MVNAMGNRVLRERLTVLLLILTPPKNEGITVICQQDQEMLAQNRHGTQTSTE